MDRQNLQRLFDINLYAAKANLADLSHEESLRWPDRANSVNWVLGHIVWARNSILGALGQEPILSDAEGAVYDRKTTKQKDSDYLPLETLQSKLEESQRRITEGLASCPDELLTKPQEQSPFPPGFQETEYDKVVFMQFHEAYHVGQLGMLRKLAGKDGAIQ